MTGGPTLRILLYGLIAIALLATLGGCGTGTLDAGGGTNTSAPLILVQPVSQSVPMGLTAQFAVSVKGYPLNYQWFKNGTSISGATGSSYTTPATTFADTGSIFTVTISNSLGAVNSSNASLTVTARAPKPGDLRFQQVDAGSTVNGYGDGATGVGSAISGRGGSYFSSSIGTPLYFSPIVCGQPPVPAGAGCEWPYEQFYLPGALTGLGLSVGYGGDFYSNFVADLYSTTFPSGGMPVSSPNSVVTSVDLESPDNLFALSWVQSTQSSGFTMSQQTVAAASLQAAASQEGISGRVITGISYSGAQVVYFSYGWTNDSSTTYDVQTPTASSATMANTAASLAAQGYIITAIGGSNLNDSYLLVGTRVHGDTMARPFLALQGNYSSLLQGGYAIVGVVQDSKGNATFLGER